MTDVPQRLPSRRVRASGVPAPEDAPELAGLLADLEAIDALQARVIDRLARLRTHHEAELATLLPVESWLLAAGLPRSDRRMLDTAASQLGRLPSVAAAFADGTVTWPQVRVVCLKVARLSDDQATEADRELAPLLARQATRDPDELAVVVDQLVAAFAAEAVDAEVQQAERGRFLAFQPRLDGTGARVYGDLDGTGYGLVSAALDAGMPLSSRAGDIGATADPASRRMTARAAAAHRADRLVQLAADDLARRAPGPDPSPGPCTTTDPVPAGGELDRTRAIAPQVTLLLTVDQLLGDDQLPAELLAPVTGGRLKVSAPVARAWIAEAGARLRTIVLDETGQALGVGRARRFAPDWLRETIEATHATCAGPGCQVSVRVCDVDHHTPWTGTDGRPGGATDLDQLGPLCRACHGAKERGWTLTRSPDGNRRWRHRRSGVTIDTTPRAQLDAPARRRRAGRRERSAAGRRAGAAARTRDGPVRDDPADGSYDPT